MMNKRLLPLFFSWWAFQLLTVLFFEQVYLAGLVSLIVVNLTYFIAPIHNRINTIKSEVGLFGQEHFNIPSVATFFICSQFFLIEFIVPVSAIIYIAPLKVNYILAFVALFFAGNISMNLAEARLNKFIQIAIILAILYDKLC